MKLRLIVLAFALGAWMPAIGIRASECDPDGNVKFICGMKAPEDLIAIPNSAWVIASGYAPGGAIHLIDTRDGTTRQAFPAASVPSRLDAKAYPSCPGPINAGEKMEFRAHGLNLRRGPSRVHVLYVVHHGFRESVEVFEVDAARSTPALTWIGCVVAPPNVGINSVSPLPDQGFAVTNLARRDLPDAQARMRDGRNTGELWEWTPRDGWRLVPDSDSPIPNGLEVSKDGQWYYVNLWSVKKVMRMSRGRTPVSKEFATLEFHPDNIRWQSDGSLYVAGQNAPTTDRVWDCLRKFCADATTNVARLDPQSLTVQTLVRDSNKKEFVSSTTGLRVGGEIWIGSMTSDRVARYPLP